MAIDLGNRVQENLFGCLEWQGPLDRDGYGRWSGQIAHRRVYEMNRGPIPPGLWIDHLCSNRKCVHIEHLEAVTPRVNVLRSPYTQASINSRKTHCIHGHPFNQENTYIRPNGLRNCRTCRRVWSKNYHSKTRPTGRRKGRDTRSTRNGPPSKPRAI